MEKIATQATTSAVPELPLYCTYPQQSAPQDAYLEIDTEADTVDAAVSWAYDAEIGGGVPSSVWHGIRLRVPCSPTLTEGQIEQLTQQVTPLVQRVLDGTDQVWDGHQYVGRLDDDATRWLASQDWWAISDQYVGRLDDDATDALSEIERDLAAEDGADVWDEETTDAGWLDGSARYATDDEGEVTAVEVPGVITVTSDTTDAELERAEEVLMAEAWRDQQTVVYGLYGSLERYRTECRRASARREEDAGGE